MTVDCTCPKTNCERHGKCEECRAHHGRKGHLPRCERPKRQGLLSHLLRGRKDGTPKV